jgi:DNA-binding NarL/FixJ family response regulator
MLVEDQTLVRDSLAQLLNGQEDMRVVCDTGSAADALALCRWHNPDLVLMDVVTEMGASGITAAAQLREEFPALKIVIMTGLPEITFIDNAKKAGVNSFLYKNINSEEMLASLRSTMKGYGMFPDDWHQAALDGYAFTANELEVLQLVCKARSRKEVAQELAMSESAVKAVISVILDKTGYDSIMKFAMYVLANGYIAPDLR